MKGRVCCTGMAVKSPIRSRITASRAHGTVNGGSDVESWAAQPGEEDAEEPCEEDAGFAPAPFAPSAGFEPAPPAPEAGALSPELRGRDGPLYDGDMAPSTVLVVDDDPVIVKLLQLNFEMEGYDVITAGDGQEGLDRARADRPDAIILDVMMPKLNGLQVAEALKADDLTRAIPIVLLSAKAQSTDIATGKEIADEYLTKPFDPLELLELVAELLKRRSG